VAGGVLLAAGVAATILILTVTGDRVVGSGSPGPSAAGASASPAAASPAVGSPMGANPTAQPSASASSPSLSPQETWKVVLAERYLARGRAFADLDESALADVYQLDSEIYAKDLALLREFAGRGGHVPALSVRIVDLQIIEQSGDRAVLRVTEQLDAYDILDAAGNRLAHEDQAAPQRYELTLVRTTAGWRLSRRVTIA